MNIYQVQHQDNNMDSDSETEESEPAHCSIKHKVTNQQLLP